MTVTVWAVLQFAGVKVRLSGLTVPSLGSLLASGMVTSAVGWLFSHTPNVICFCAPLASLVVPALVETFTPATSLSLIVKMYLAGVPRLALVGAPISATIVSGSSAMRSLITSKGSRTLVAPGGMLTVPLLRPV